MQGIHIPNAQRAIGRGGGEMPMDSINAEAEHRVRVGPHQRVVTTAAHVQEAQGTGGGGRQDPKAVRGDGRQAHGALVL